MHLLYFTDKTGLKGTQREHDVKIHYAHPFSDDTLYQDNV